MGHKWKVVGGADKGGILVREGQATSSPQTAERLAYGALVEELNLIGERLHYKKCEGDGPETGWVSLKVGGKDICVKFTAPEPPIPSNAPRCLQPAKETAPNFLPCPFPLAPTRRMSKKKLVEAASQRGNGDMYGLPFPWTPEELNSKEFGAEWLTRALHAAGSLAKDNSITRIVSCKRFEGGGSGPKAIISVEYAKPDDSLDVTLFVKMPHPLSENTDMRFIQEGQMKFGDNWGGEVMFYRFLAPHLPFAVPKLYFGDVCRATTESILINSCVDWPEKSKHDFLPYEVLPPCGKCEDYLLKNPQDYYFAIMRRLGLFAGMAKSNKLGPEVTQLPWYEYTPTNDVNCMPGFPGVEEGVTAFIKDVVPHWFSDNVRSQTVLTKFTTKIQKTHELQKKIGENLYGDPLYVGLHHQNGNTDNCFFYEREDGVVDCGVLDWGSTSSLAYGTGLTGCTISAMGEMLAEYDEKLVECWADAYHETGAPKLLLRELLFKYRIATCISANGIFASAAQMAALKDVFKQWQGYPCEELSKADFGLRFGMGMLYNRIMLFALKGDYYWDALAELKSRTPQDPKAPKA